MEEYLSQHKYKIALVAALASLIPLFLSVIVALSPDPQPSQEKSSVPVGKLGILADSPPETEATPGQSATTGREDPKSTEAKIRIEVSALDSSAGVSKYRCFEAPNRPAAEKWGVSKARKALIDNSGSQARTERGETYAGFMDAFWAEIDHRNKLQNVETVEKLLLTVMHSYHAAYSNKARSVQRQNAEPLLYFRGLTQHGRKELLFDPSDFGAPNNISLRVLGKTLSQLTDGLGIYVMFQQEPVNRTDPKNFIMVPVVTQLLIDDRNDPDIVHSEMDQMLGYSEYWSSYSYWDEVNLKDSVLCGYFVR